MASVQGYTIGSGERRWAVRWRDSSGKARWRSVPGPKRNADKVKADLEARLALGPLYEAPPERLGPFLEAWLERYGQRVRASTRLRREQALRALGVLVAKEGSFGGKTGGLDTEYLQRLTVADVEDAVAALAHRAPRQAQIALASLKLALADAAKRGQRFDAAILELTPPRSEEREARFLSWPEVETLASWIPEAMRRLVLVAALTGARQGELLALRESDLSLDAARLLIRRSGKGRTKTKRSERAVSLPALAVSLLREQLVARPHTHGGLVFPAPKGGQWERNRFMERVFRPAAIAAGLGRRDEGARYEGIDFHALRHTAISLMALAGMPVEHVAKQVGHADGGALILRRYRHLFSGEMEAQVAKLDALVREGPGEAAKEEAG